MACLYYATFLVLLCQMKGAIAGTVTTGNTCAATSDCADATNNVCVPTVLKCLIKPSASCSTTDDKCVTGATCSGGTPTCSSCETTKHIAATPTDYCRLKLDQSCSATTAPCLDNGECASSTCKCKTGYVASADKLSCTIQANSYGASCTPGGGTDTCTSYDTNSECPSGQTTCKCKATYYGVIGSKCGVAVDASCSNNIVCLPNAECLGTFCKCKTGYTANGAKTECAVTANTYGGICTVTGSTDSCVATDSNSVCNTLTNKCECKQGFAGSIGVKCWLKLDQSCSASTASCPDNGECASSTCKCKTGYVASTDKTACTIQANSYGASCTPGGATDTCTSYDTNSECPTGQTTCKCKANYYGVIGSKCGLAVDATCSSTSVCLPNAECSGTSCKCKTGYTANGAKTECAVTANTYGGICTVASSIDSCVATDSNSVCNTLTSKCECKQGFTGSIGAKCSGAMGLASSLFLVIASLFIVTRLH